MRMNRIVSKLAFAVLAASLAGCTTRSPEALEQHDPFEPTNRAVFNVTQKVDKYVLKPVAKGYVAVVPQPARDGIHNALTNLNEPVTLGNNILQGNVKSAGRTVARIVINSTVGVGGLIDVAGKIGIADDQQDLGITLGKYGLPEGPYLFLPFLGPAPPRDAIGDVGDYFMDPFQYVRFPGRHTLIYVRQGVGIIDLRAQTLDQLDAIERTSVDFYAATRSLYRQSRDAKINGSQPQNPQNLPNF
jgi:phospholipid-binding lipoprotein MlaA